MESCYSWLASLLDPESNRRYRGTWSPDSLPRIAVFCPWMVYGRIENRIQDLELGGDGFGIPYCDCNLRCMCGAFQFCCCCCCCCTFLSPRLSYPLPSPASIPCHGPLHTRETRDGPVVC